MPLASPYQQYHQASTRTADRGQLLILTYEALLRWLARADVAIDAENVPDAHTALVNAQTLIQQLSLSLDVEQGGEIAANLKRLYDFMLDRLKWANVRKDKELIDEVRGLVAPLLSAWRVAVDEARRAGQITA